MVEAARTALSDEMRELQQDLLTMGSVVEQMLHKSVEALRMGNPILADEAIAMDDIVDGYNLAIENKCLRLLALHQPMASDLRTIATALKMLTDMERMGDYVVDIAKTASRLSDEPLFKPLVDIPHMADLVKRMLREMLEAFVSRDLGLIQKMVEHDDEVDSLDKSLNDELIALMKKDPTTTNQALSLLMVSRYLERLADHVTNIGERVYHMQTGELRELHQKHASAH